MSTFDKPIAKQFIHNGKCFLYDTYKNQLFCVSPEQYLEITELLKIGVSQYKLLKKNTQQYYDVTMMLQKGLMRPAFVDEVINPATEYIENIVDRCINDLTLQVTRDCNFRCRYCLYANSNGIERGHEKINMNWNIARRSVDYLYEHSKDSTAISIAFYGGEPMLNFKLIKSVVEYSEKLFYTKPIKFSMTINGSILTDYMIDFLVKHNFYITISFDGPSEIQNEHRRFNRTGQGTFLDVYSNVKKIKQKYSNYFSNNVSFLPVIFEDENEKKVIDFYQDNNIENEKISLVEADLTGIDYKPRGLTNYAMEREKYAVDMSCFEKKGGIPSRWHHAGPCIPAIKSLFVDINGYFFPCESVIAYEELAIGNIENGIDLNKVKSMMNIGQLTIEECKNCWLMRFCRICMLTCIDVESRVITRERKLTSCKGQEERALAFLKYYIDNLEGNSKDE